MFVIVFTLERLDGRWRWKQREGLGKIVLAGDQLPFEMQMREMRVLMTRLGVAAHARVQKSPPLRKRPE